MAKLSLKASRKGILTFLIVDVVVLLGCIGGYYSASGILGAAKSELKGKEKQVSEAEQMAQTLERSKLSYLDSRAQIRCLEASVSTQAYVPTLLDQIEALGKSVDLKVQSVRPIVNNSAPVAKASEGGTAKEKPKPYDELCIDVEVEGKYVNALDFLYKVTSFPKIISVNSVQMSPNSPAGWKGSPNLKIAISLTAYVLKDDGEPVEKDTSKTDSKNVSAGIQGGTENAAG